MSQVSVSDSDKDWFDDYQEDGETQADTFHRMRKQVMAFEGEPVDVDALADELSHTLIPMTELASYRGVKAAMEGDK